jgi:TRAP-type C4-dicarboxylate transport system permease small subunit
LNKRGIFTSATRGKVDMLKTKIDILKMCHTATIVPLLALVMITTIDVIARYLFKTAVLDTIEISGMLLGTVISIAFALTTYKEEHVKFSMIVDRFPARAQMVTEVITFFLSAGIFILMAWQAVNRVIYSIKSGEFTGAMEIPIWPVKLVFAFGCLLTSLSLIIRFVTAFRRLLPVIK